MCILTIELVWENKYSIYFIKNIIYETAGNDSMKVNYPQHMSNFTWSIFYLSKVALKYNLL